MNNLPARIGFWAAVSQTIFSVIYLAGLIILIASLFSQQSPAEVAAYQWTNIYDYAAHYTDNPFTMTVSLVVQVDVFLTGLSVLVIYQVLHEMAAPSKKILTRLSSAFALLVAAVSCAAYYIQIASVHQAIWNGGDLEGLAQFAESNVTSPAMALMQLAWTLFYGLTTLVAASLFENKGLERWIRLAFLVNGLIGVTVGILYACGVTTALPVSILGLIATSFAYPLLAVLFRRSSRESKLSLSHSPA